MQDHDTPQYKCGYSGNNILNFSGSHHHVQIQFAYWVPSMEIIQLDQMAMHIRFSVIWVTNQAKGFGPCIPQPQTGFFWIPID